jgi:hypothetical protein
LECASLTFTANTAPRIIKSRRILAYRSKQVFGSDCNKMIGFIINRQAPSKMIASEPPSSGAFHAYYYPSVTRSQVKIGISIPRISILPRTDHSTLGKGHQISQGLLPSCGHGLSLLVLLLLPISRLPRWGKLGELDLA